MPYSELKLNTPELQELARQKIAQAVKDHPNLSVQARWNKVKEENPKLFGDLQAADWMADDEAEEREGEETHGGAFQPSAASQHQFSLADHMALFALERLNQIKLERPKKVEATNEAVVLCVGGFSNPLF
jgi:hypothetical protein